MRNQQLYKKISYAYLSIIPLLTAVLGFTLNNVSYQVYLPIWIINVLLMLAAAYQLGARSIVAGTTRQKHLAASGFLLTAPWIFFTIFAGMGSPPPTYASWVASAFEQQVRYSFLIIGGVLLTLGFAVLREQIKDNNGNILSLLGYTAIAIAMPLFILNMCYWHSYLLQTFKTQDALRLNQLPEWYQPAKKLFGVIAIVEISLTYLATAAFAASLKLAGWFTKGASRVYISISLLAFAAVSLYGFYPESIIANGFPFYPFMIPAIPFITPFYMGVNLLRRIEN